MKKISYFSVALFVMLVVFSLSFTRLINAEQNIRSFEGSHSRSNTQLRKTASIDVPDTIETNIHNQKNEKQNNELEEQKRILQQFKPLIKPRSYKDLITYLDTQIPPLALNRLPELNELMIPRRAPNVRLIPYLRKSFAHPAYTARLNNIDYLIAVNCNDPSGFDDCSTTPHNQFKNKHVFARFIQTNDLNFQFIEGLKIGVSFSQVKHLFNDNAKILGDGECLQTQSEWAACFDSTDTNINRSTLKMMPTDGAKLRRFLKIKGRAYE